MTPWINKEIQYLMSKRDCPCKGLIQKNIKHNKFDPISAGVVCTPVHAEEEGMAKMPYPSNFCFKHPMKLKLGMDDQHNN